MTKRLGYRLELDGIRGMAVFFVFLFHTKVPPFAHRGGMGVAMFFALSGFLITSLLIEEKELHGRIDYFGFYRRRFLRLIPALLCVCTLTYIFGGVSHLQVLSVLLYVGNFQSLGDNRLGWLHHTWSLSIEEQYYVFWPLILSFWSPQRSKKYLYAIGFGFIALAAWRAHLWYQTHAVERVYFGTDTNFASLLAGCFSAVLWHARRDAIGSPILIYLSFLSLVILVGGLSVLPGGKDYFIYSKEFVNAYSWSIVGGATAVLIFNLMCTRDSLVYRILRLRPLIYLGQTSYGFYLWHLPVIHTVSRLYPDLKRPLFLLPLCLLVSHCSYAFIEKPFLKLKRHSTKINRKTREVGAAESI